MLDAGGVGMYTSYMPPTRTIPSHDLRQNLRDTLDFIQGGGRVVVTRSGREVAVMLPTDSPRQPDALGPGWELCEVAAPPGIYVRTLPSGHVLVGPCEGGWFASVDPGRPYEAKVARDAPTPSAALGALLAMGRDAMPSEAHREVFDELVREERPVLAGLCGPVGQIGNVFIVNDFLAPKAR